MVARQNSSRADGEKTQSVLLDNSTSQVVFKREFLCQGSGPWARCIKIIIWATKKGPLPGCSFQMPGRARFSVTISHRHGVFLCFFLIQGAFLWDGLGRDVDVHLHLRHIYDTTSRMGWGGLRRVNNFGRLYSPFQVSRGPSGNAETFRQTRTWNCSASHAVLCLPCLTFSRYQHIILVAPKKSEVALNCYLGFNIHSSFFFKQSKGIAKKCKKHPPHT